MYSLHHHCIFTFKIGRWNEDNNGNENNRIPLSLNQDAFPKVQHLIGQYSHGTAECGTYHSAGENFEPISASQIFEVIENNDTHLEAKNAPDKSKMRRPSSASSVERSNSQSKQRK